jgi:hypothetical protein
VGRSIKGSGVEKEVQLAKLQEGHVPLSIQKKKLARQRLFSGLHHRGPSTDTGIPSKRCRFKGAKTFSPLGSHLFDPSLNPTEFVRDPSPFPLQREGAVLRFGAEREGFGLTRLSAKPSDPCGVKANRSENPNK